MTARIFPTAYTLAGRTAWIVFGSEGDFKRGNSGNSTGISEAGRDTIPNHKSRCNVSESLGLGHIIRFKCALGRSKERVGNKSVRDGYGKHLDFQGVEGNTRGINIYKTTRTSRRGTTGTNPRETEAAARLVEGGGD